MAKQSSGINICANIGEICFYQMDGQFYARTKSSLNRERFLKDEAFEGSRSSARRFGASNRLAGIVYKNAGLRHKYSLFCEIRKKAIRLLKDGYPEALVTSTLTELYCKIESPVRKIKTNKKPKLYHIQLHRLIPAELQVLLDAGIYVVSGKQGIKRKGKTRALVWVNKYGLFQEDLILM